MTTNTLQHILKDATHSHRAELYAAAIDTLTAGLRTVAHDERAPIYNARGVNRVMLSLQEENYRTILQSHAQEDFEQAFTEAETHYERAFSFLNRGDLARRQEKKKEFGEYLGQANILIDDMPDDGWQKILASEFWRQHALMSYAQERYQSAWAKLRGAEVLAAGAAKELPEEEEAQFLLAYCLQPQGSVALALDDQDMIAASVPKVEQALIYFLNLADQRGMRTTAETLKGLQQRLE